MKPETWQTIKQWRQGAKKKLKASNDTLARLIEAPNILGQTKTFTELESYYNDLIVLDKEYWWKKDVKLKLKRVYYCHVNDTKYVTFFKKNNMGSDPKRKYENFLADNDLLFL